MILSAEAQPSLRGTVDESSKDSQLVPAAVGDSLIDDWFVRMLSDPHDTSGHGRLDILRLQGAASY